MEGHDAVVVTSFLQLGDAFRPVLIGFEAKIINHGDVRPQYLELLRRLGAAGYRWQWSWPSRCMRRRCLRSSRAGCKVAVRSVRSDTARIVRGRGGFDGGGMASH